MLINIDLSVNSILLIVYKMYILLLIIDKNQKQIF